MATFRLAIGADCSCLGVKQDYVIGRVHIYEAAPSRAIGYLERSQHRLEDAGGATRRRRRSDRIISLDVRYWPKADMVKNAIDVAIGGKADMGWCGANVCF